MAMHCQCAVNNNDELRIVEKPCKSTLEQINCEYTNSLFPKLVQKKNKKIEVKRKDISQRQRKPGHTVAEDKRYTIHTIKKAMERLRRIGHNIDMGIP